MKKIKYVITLSVICFFQFCMVVNASDDGIFTIANEDALDACLQNESICKLTADISVNSTKIISDDMVLDLNGHSIIADSSLQLKSGLLGVNRGAKLTINDSKGTGKISTGTGDNVWAAIQLIKNNTGEGIAELVVNGGTIEGYYYGVVGNGNVHNTKVTINGGVIRGLNQEDSVGIYQPQKGELIINNRIIEGGTGIEIRSGSLTVNDGTIKGLATRFIKMVNTNGTTTNGVGIAIAQHTTKNAIQVTINNGNISGQYALYEWNPHNNSSEDLSHINLRINGGNFTGFATGVRTVYSEDFTAFIAGGHFNKDVSEYLTSDAKLTAKMDENSLYTFKEQTEKKNNSIVILLTILLISGGIIGFIYCKKNHILFSK